MWKPGPTNQLALGIVMLAVFANACASLYTPKVLDMMNSPSSGSPPPGASVRSRVARLVRANLDDSYFAADPVPDGVAHWMETLGETPGPLLDQLNCLHMHRSTSPQECYQTLRDAVLPAAKASDGGSASAWGVAAVPRLSTEDRCVASPLECVSVGTIVAKAAAANCSNDPKHPFTCRVVSSESLRPPVGGGALSVDVRRELDAERFVANALSIGPTLIALEDALGRPLTSDELSAGIRDGARESASYVRAKWHRDDSRASTALVMSGGAATGAFTAGFVWRLLEALRRCHGGQLQGCKNARIDLVVGTSTGALVGVIVDLFHMQEQRNEMEAMDLLVQKYTCVDESKLYCVNEAPDWKLASSVRGLVQFRGIRNDLLTVLSRAQIGTNLLELVTVTVDYDSGDVFGISDQDPADAADLNGRTDAVLASIVEPFMADPVDTMGRQNGPPYIGTFIDGGIRSGLPVMEAMRRGAERVIAISTSGIEAGPISHPRHALSIVFRTIDLLVQQPRVGEVQQAEFAAVARRMAEYDLCTTHRFRSVTVLGDREAFCRRSALFPGAGPQGAETMWIGPMMFPQVARTWQTEWIYRPEENPKAPAASGYSFDPVLMRVLFKQGLMVFASRCDQTLAMVGVPPDGRAVECSTARASEVNAQIEALLKAHPPDACRSKGVKYKPCDK